MVLSTAAARSLSAADDDAIRMQEVDDGGSFTEKLRVRNHIEEMAIDAIALHGTTNPLVGIDRHGTFFDDHFIGSDRACYFTGDGFNIGEVRIPCLGLRGTYRDKDGIALARSLGQIRHKANSGIAITLQQSRQVIFVDEGISPPCSAATFRSSLSTQITSWPISAKQTAATKPT